MDLVRILPNGTGATHAGTGHSQVSTTSTGSSVTVPSTMR